MQGHMGVHTKRYALWLFLMSAFLFFGCREKGNYTPSGEKMVEEKGGSLVLGVMPSLPPTKLFMKYQPLADYLTKKSGIPVTISTAPSFQEYIVRLQNGEYELILPNPYQYIMVSKTLGYTPLAKVRGVPFQGLIVVRKDSGISNVADLKGKKIAYPDPSALAATMQVRAYLKRQGIDPERDTMESYAASQDSVILGVYQRLFDAAGTWPEALDAMPDDIRRELKVLAETETLPHRPIAVRGDVPSDLADKVKDALLLIGNDPEGQNILASLGYKGFEEASDSDYDEVRRWAKKNGFPF